jgi:signal peptidase I
VFVESLEVQSGERQSAEGAMREAITALLGQAAEALDAWPALSTSPQLKPPKASAGLGRTPARGRPRRHAVRYVLAAIVAIVAAILVGGFVVRPYVVPSVSMAAAASPREGVFVDRIIYRFRSVHRGDLVVFDDPRPPHEMLMTRVVGLPGDWLSLRRGYLFVDGVQTSEALSGRVADLALSTGLNAGTMAGIHWTVTHPYRLPAGEYFVASDDPAGHRGTLGGGIVPRRAIVGQAFLSFWPLGRVSRL